MRRFFIVMVLMLSVSMAWSQADSKLTGPRAYETSDAMAVQGNSDHDGSVGPLAIADKSNPADPAKGRDALQPGVMKDAAHVKNVNGADSTAGPPSATFFQCLTDLGDVNMAGTITACDSSLILQHVVGLITLTVEQQCRADVNENTFITAYDASLTLQCVVGLCGNLWGEFLNSCGAHGNCI